MRGVREDGHCAARQAVSEELHRGGRSLVVLAAASLAGWLYFAPPELIRVGSAYSAKIVCSNVFLAKRNAMQVLSDDVQAPGHPLLRIMRVAVDL